MEIAKYAKPGARYRVCPWSDLNKPKLQIVGYGLEEKQAGKRGYVPVGWNGEIHPWKTLAEARAVVDLLNEAARRVQAITLNREGIMSTAAISQNSETMTKEQMEARISVLSDEIDANEEENRMMNSEIDMLYKRIDEMKTN